MMAIVYNRKPLKPNGLDGSVIKWLDGSKPDCFNCKKNWPIVWPLERWRSSIAVSIFIGKSVIIERWCGGTRKNYFNRIELQANKMSPSDTNHRYVLMCALHPRRFASRFFGFSSSLLSVYFVNINPPTTSLLLFFKPGQWRDTRMQISWRRCTVRVPRAPPPPEWLHQSGTKNRVSIKQNVRQHHIK